MLAGMATRQEVDDSEVIVDVAGHVAIDLRLAGEITPKRSLARKLNPSPAMRHLRGAWRVGRLRAALPALC